MTEYKVRTVSGEKKFQLLLNDMANQAIGSFHLVI